MHHLHRPPKSDVVLGCATHPSPYPSGSRGVPETVVEGDGCRDWGRRGRRVPGLGPKRDMGAGTGVQEGGGCRDRGRRERRVPGLGMKKEGVQIQIGNRRHGSVPDHRVRLCPAGLESHCGWWGWVPTDRDRVRAPWSRGIPESPEGVHGAGVVTLRPWTVWETDRTSGGRGSGTTRRHYPQNPLASVGPTTGPGVTGRGAGSGFQLGCPCPKVGS